MLQALKDMRRLITHIELEAGVKHPDKPDYADMAKNAESLRLKCEQLSVEIGELR